MAINNVYNQTPKRIFTNKPFIKGMSYTNAGMSPYVCRSVANLDMESSSSATKVRQGSTNVILKSDCEILKFYDKYLSIPNVMTEVSYRSRSPFNTAISADKMGLHLFSGDFNTEYTFYTKVIYNDTTLEYDDTLNCMGEYLLELSDITTFFVLKLNDGSVPHTINHNNKSISFFGAIGLLYDGKVSSYSYVGLITIYFHKAANQAVVEVLRPTINDPSDVLSYGSNIFAKNPLVYKDYVHISNTLDSYLDYANISGDKLIDITTVQVYDSPVNPVVTETYSTANLVDGFDKNETKTVYIRPFVVLPKSNFSAVLSATAPGTSGEQYYYDFDNARFIKDPTSKQKVPTSVIKGNMECTSTPDISIPGFSNKVENLYMTAKPVADLTGTSFTMKFFGSQTYFTPLFNSIETTYSTTELENFFIDNSHYPSYVNAVGNCKLSMDSTGADFTHAVSQAVISVVPTHLDINSTGDINVPVNISLVHSLYRASSKDGVYRADLSDRPYQDTGIKITGGQCSSGYTTSGTFNIVGTTLEDVKKGNLSLLYDTSGKYSDGTTYYVKNLVSPHSGKVIAEVTYTKESSTSGTNADEVKYTLRYSLRSFKNRVVNEDVSSGIEFLIGLARIYDHDYPYAVIKYDIGRVSNILQYTLNIDGTDLVINPKVNITELQKYMLGEVRTICSNVTNSITNETFDSTTGILDSIKIPRADAALQYNVFSNTVSNSLVYSTPLFEILEPVEKTIIADSYVKHVQTISSTGVMSANYNLPMSTSAVNSIPKVSDVGAVVFNVTIFPSVEGNAFESSDSVSSVSAIIKTYTNDIVKYNALADDTCFTTGVDHVSMHLGHYVFWGSKTKSNTLFYSEFNNPAYIPSMYAIDFDNPIVHVHPHQGNLVVFTTNDIYLLHSGNVPSTTVTDGSEIAFTQSLIQSNTRLGYENAGTVKSIGKDVFFISDSGDGYLLKTNRYVSDSSDTYLVKITHQIEDLLKNPFEYAKLRALNYGVTLEYQNPIDFKPIKQTIADKIQCNINTFIDYNTNALRGFRIIEVNPEDITVQDGDTFYHNGVTYRMADINTPEISNNEKLAVVAKNMLIKMVNKPNYKIYLCYRANLTDAYGRVLVWVITRLSSSINLLTYVNAELVKNGLADVYMENEYSNKLILNPSGDNIYIATGTPASSYINAQLDFAIKHNLGVHNNLNYSESIDTEVYELYLYNSNKYKLFTYATNSYIYIIQSILFSNNTGFTIIYKYNIDARTWITYDFIGAACPIEALPDNTTTGFAIICSNTDKAFNNQIYSYLSFNNTKVDSNPVVGYLGNIHAYFDTGNQSIAIMNEKLFREFKLSLGAADTKELDIQYKIKMFVDGVEIIDKDKHFKGKQETINGFKKITFFAPGRGRIPRYTVDITCESDVNILEYAIVYLQLNAK